MTLNLDDVIATLIFLIFIVLVIAIIFIAIKGLRNSTKEKQLINQKLDTVLKKLDELNKN
ncbi:hypothetical protein MKY09_00935 [Psychrobacillus sp. FSL K6-4046]|uniref:hypothetical protein n=1 Tax=Psychrobacillus sp. FSL K6-4046 TaxID=2921550 RepID=UPI00315ADBA9